MTEAGTGLGANIPELHMAILRPTCQEWIGKGATDMRMLVGV